MPDTALAKLCQLSSPDLRASFSGPVMSSARPFASSFVRSMASFALSQALLPASAACLRAPPAPLAAEPARPSAASVSARDLLRRSAEAAASPVGSLAASGPFMAAPRAASKVRGAVARSARSEAEVRAALARPRAASAAAVRPRLGTANGLSANAWSKAVCAAVVAAVAEPLNRFSIWPRSRSGTTGIRRSTPSASSPAFTPSMKPLIRETTPFSIASTPSIRLFAA